MARWTKKSLNFPLTNATEQVTFIDRLKRKLKVNLQVKADQRGITLILHGDTEQVRRATNQVQVIYREFR